MPGKQLIIVGVLWIDKKNGKIVNPIQDLFKYYQLFLG
jgi:hypothetical protein